MRLRRRQTHADDPFWPAPARTPTPFANALKVVEPFVYGEIEFYKGMVVSPTEPIVQQLAREHPERFEIAQYPPA